MPKRKIILREADVMSGVVSMNLATKPVVSFAYSISPTPTFLSDCFSQQNFSVIHSHHPHEESEMSKLRILCLHGFTANGGVHAHQARHITKALSSHFDFLFPDGPHEVDLSTQMNLSDPSTKAWSEHVSTISTSGHRAWWFARDPNPASGEPGGFHGLERSIEHLGDLIRTTGPVHAIWGFSQGACFAGMLVSLLSQKNRDHPLRQLLPKAQGLPNAGIFFSGFKARFEEYDEVYAPGIEIPTMHVMGELDETVTVERSMTLVSVCKHASVLRHGGGHDLPRTDEDRERIVQFLLDNVQSRPAISL